MMVPDYALIGEIMFFSFGFLAGRVCGKKMVATFKLWYGIKAWHGIAIWYGRAVLVCCRIQVHARKQ
jgi:hypothetical protein